MVIGRLVDTFYTAAGSQPTPARDAREAVGGLVRAAADEFVDARFPRDRHRVARADDGVARLMGPVRRPTRLALDAIDLRLCLDLRPGNRVRADPVPDLPRRPVAAGGPGAGLAIS